MISKKPEKVLTIYKDAYVVQETSSNNITTGDYDRCVIINAKYNETLASHIDIFEILRGDKLKAEIFKANFLHSYELKKGMEFETFARITEHQQWTVYFKKLPKGKILAFLLYTWSHDSMLKYFAEVGEKINNAYDLRGVNVNCHGGVKVFNNTDWEIKSKNKATWSCRVSSNDMGKSDAQRYFSQISKNIIVDSVEYIKNNGGFHNFSRTDLYDLKINVSIKNISIDKISIEDLKKEVGFDKYFVDGDKIYLIEEEGYSDPVVSILHINDGIINKCSTHHRYRFYNFIGKKISI